MAKHKGEYKVNDLYNVGRTAVIRALSLGSKQLGDSQTVPDDPFAKTGLYEGGTKGARRLIIPPLGPTSLSDLVDIVDESNILPQSIEAFETNIEGFGHRFDVVESLADEENPDPQPKGNQQEFDRLNEFFEYANPEGSFIKLRKQKRRDQESMGFAAWEVIRELSPDRYVQRFNHIPGHTLRISVYDPDLVDTVEKRRIVGKIVELKMKRRFRTFAQVNWNTGKPEMTWFKEFGDPRTMDPKTGKLYNRPGSFAGVPANEVILWQRGYHAKSPYSIPRWIGNLPAVLGSRASGEVNLLYFDNKGVPPLAILVSGGKLTKQTMKQINETLEHEIKGRGNFHRILVLEALPVGSDSADSTVKTPRIELKPLNDAQIKDAMFMGYDSANRTQTRSSFRLPPMLTGESADYNRATAEAAGHMAEEQVFKPERVDFDYWLNRFLMPELGVATWTIVSNGPNVTKNEDLIQLLSGDTSGAMTPNIGRQIFTDILERRVPQIKEDWGNQPFQMALSQMSAVLAQAAAEQQMAHQQNMAQQQARNVPPPKVVLERWTKLMLGMPGVKAEVVKQIRQEMTKEIAKREKRGRAA